MKKYISNLNIALKGETLKKKGTGIYTSSFIIGVFMPIVYFLFNIFSDKKTEYGADFNFITNFVHEVINPLAVFFLPLIIIINASKIAQLDHKNGGWNLMETQPLQKFSIYFSKLIVLFIANFIVIFSFFISSVLLAMLLSLFIEIPEYVSFQIELYSLINLLVRVFVASIFLTSLQYLLSVLIPSFIWSLLIGFFLLISNTILSSFNLIPDWSPIEILNKISIYKEGSDIGNYFLYTETMSIILGLFTMYIGFQWYKNKSFLKAFISPSKKMALSALVVIFCVLLSVLILKPNQYKEIKSTILAGTIESNSNFKQAYIIHPKIGDTLCSIPINNNKFNISIKSKLPLDEYQIVIDNSFAFNLVMSNNDSIFTIIKHIDNKLVTKFLGTRLAENQYKKSNSLNWNIIEYYLEQNQLLDEPKLFFNDLNDEWEKKYLSTNDFKTRDNYIPKADFIELEKKLISLEYLNYINEYLDKRKSLYPNIKTKIPSNIQQIKKEIKLDDETLISHDSYLKYIAYEVCKNDNRDIDTKIKEIENISKLKESKFKNRLLYSYLKTNLEGATSSDERKNIITSYADYITDAKLKTNLENNFRTFERLGKGNEAREIALKDLNGTLLNLSKFKGKFIAIDVWATWCGPCKYESPYFEKMAIKYKKENVVFVAMSSDKNEKAWYLDAKNKSKSVQQFHLENAVAFSKDYNFNSIPRFILIDDKGKIYNASMPRPSEASFEMVLRKALNLNDLN
jgi:thiol-disulfide isomerase/thioredoxin